MCGRYALFLTLDELRHVFGILGRLPETAPRWNIAPGQDVPIVRLVEGVRRLAMARWGFLPRWAKAGSPPAPMINARGETIDTKPSFRDAFRHRRCLVIANGFHEWQARGKGPKRPFHARAKDGAPFAMAGIWERARGADGTEHDFVAIVTTQANALLAPIHERMPVLLPPDAWDDWLDTARVGPEEAKTLIRPAPEDWLEVYPIATAVNRAASDGPALIVPVPGFAKDPEAVETAKKKPGVGGQAKLL